MRLIIIYFFIKRLILFLHAAFSLLNGAEFINLDHQRLYFTNTNKVIAWQKQPSNVNCSLYLVESVSIASTCTSHNETKINSWLTNDTEIVISADNLTCAHRLLHFNITLMNGQRRICQSLLTVFQLDPQGTIITLLKLLYYSHGSQLPIVISAGGGGGMLCMSP